MKDPTEREMLSDPDLWPNWPVLPVVKRSKKPGVWPKTGTMVAIEEHKTTVFEFNIFAVSGRSLRDVIAELKPEQVHKFESVDEIIAAGWEVD
jgi:hypothetical protein